ncbi:MAG: hypothetical protein JWR10_3340 [Rubritepida sp.]|nr:hypothetical protein [Rubritepida sp.]
MHEHIEPPEVHPVMKQTPGSPRPRRKCPSDAGFDVWLGRSLQDSYGDVAEEPVPRELLELIALTNSTT